MGESWDDRLDNFPPSGAAAEDVSKAVTFLPRMKFASMSSAMHRGALVDGDSLIRCSELIKSYLRDLVITIRRRDVSVAQSWRQDCRHRHSPFEVSSLAPAFEIYTVR